MQQSIFSKLLPRQHRGLSMVELMVAITIGTIISAGVLQIFISNKAAYQVIDSLGELQENGRSSLTRLNHAIMMADHWGVMDNTAVATQLQASASIMANIVAKGSCDGSWAFQTTSSNGNLVVNSIEGYDGRGTISNIETNTNLPAGCITDYIANSDVLIVRYADSSRLVQQSEVNNAANPNYARTIFVRGGIVSTTKVLTSAANIIYGENIPSPGTPNSAGIYNYPYSVEVYFLKSCSKTDVNGCVDTTPTLTRLRLSSEGSTQPQIIEEAIAENIEQLQFIYGIDTDNDGFINQYNTATEINASATDALVWAQVLSVHVSLLARTGEADLEYADSNSYQLTNYSFTPASGDLNYHRKRFEQVIQIRNRTRS